MHCEIMLLQINTLFVSKPTAWIAICFIKSEPTKIIALFLNIKLQDIKMKLFYIALIWTCVVLITQTKFLLVEVEEKLPQGRLKHEAAGNILVQPI